MTRDDRIDLEFRNITLSIGPFKAAEKVCADWGLYCHTVAGVLFEALPSTCCFDDVLQAHSADTHAACMLYCKLVLQSSMC